MKNIAIGLLLGAITTMAVMGLGAKAQSVSAAGRWTIFDCPSLAKHCFLVDTMTGHVFNLKVDVQDSQYVWEECEILYLRPRQPAK